MGARGKDDKPNCLQEGSRREESIRHTDEACAGMLTEQTP